MVFLVSAMLVHDQLWALILRLGSVVYPSWLLSSLTLAGITDIFSL